MELGDYVYLQQTTPTTLDVTTDRVILHVQKVLPFEIFLLEGQDGQTWKDHVCNCALCHLPNVDGQIDPSLAVIHVGLQCMLCGQFTRTANMLVYDRCSRGFFETTLGPNPNKQMVLPLVHPIDMVPIVT